jgi:hypothetical protein
MKIGFSFYGIIFGDGTNTKTHSERDFRHCWPSLKRDLIDPFIAQGHECKIYFSGYPFMDIEIEKQFYEMVKPDKVCFSDWKDSNPFTSKGKAFDNLIGEDLDVVIFTRSDIHFNKLISSGLKMILIFMPHMPQVFMESGIQKRKMKI